MKPDFEKAARDTVAHWFVDEWAGCRPRPEEAGRDTLIAQIKTAIEATWNAAIEDAARVAERTELLRTDGEDPIRTANDLLQIIVVPAIRALKSEATP